MSANWKRTANETNGVMMKAKALLDEGTPFSWDRGYLKGVVAALGWALSQYIRDPLENYEDGEETEWREPWAA